MDDVVELLTNAGARPIEPVDELHPYAIAGGVKWPRMVYRPPPSFAYGVKIAYCSLDKDMSDVFRRFDEMEAEMEAVGPPYRPWPHKIVVEGVIHRDGTTSFRRVINWPGETQKIDKKIVKYMNAFQFEPAELRGQRIDVSWYVELGNP